MNPATAAIISDADGGDTYGRGEKIRVGLTFGEAVNVTGGPRLKIRMDPHYCEKWADYESGGDTNSPTFAYQVVAVNRSPQGIAVLARTLQLNGSTICSADTRTGAYLAHRGLGHDGNHRVDWRRSGDCEQPGGC